MPQIVMTELGNTVAHLRMPRRQISLCGEDISVYGIKLSADRSEWPNADFCARCLVAYEARLAADVPATHPSALQEPTIVQHAHGIVQALAEIESALAEESPAESELAIRLHELRELLDTYVATLSAEDTALSGHRSPDEDRDAPG